MLKKLSLKGQGFSYPEQSIIKEAMFNGKHLHEIRYPLMRASAFYEHYHLVKIVFPAIRKVFLEQNFVQHDTSQALMCVLGLNPHFRVDWVFVGKDRAGQDYGLPDFDHVIGLVRNLLKVAFEEPRTVAYNVVPVSFTAEKVDRDLTFIRDVVGEDDFMIVKVWFMMFRDVGITFFPSANCFENRFGGIKPALQSFPARALPSCEPARRRSHRLRLGPHAANPGEPSRQGLYTLKRLTMPDSSSSVTASSRDSLHIGTDLRRCRHRRRPLPAPSASRNSLCRHLQIQPSSGDPSQSLPQLWLAKPAAPAATRVYDARVLTV